MNINKNRNLVKFYKLFPPQSTVLLIAFLVGILAALGNVILRLSVEFIEKNILLKITPPGTGFSISRLFLVLIPIIGAILLFGFLKLLKTDSDGYGFPKFLENVNLRGGILTIKDFFKQIIGATITLGFGGSAGLEGPSAVEGSVVGVIVSKYFNSSSSRKKVLIASGAAAAIASNFNAPITGVFFALELVLLREYELESLGAIVIASAMGTVVSRAIFGHNPIFVVPHYELKNGIELIYYTIFGIIVGILAAIFTKLFYRTKDLIEILWKKLGITSTLTRLLIGFTLVGIIGIFTPGVMGGGYEFIHRALTNRITLFLLIIMIFTKMFATAITLNSGGIGGMFGPAMFIGAMVGAAYGNILNISLNANIAPGAYAIVGVGAFLAALTHAPLTGIFLLFEMTGDYQIMIPGMIVSIIGLFFSRALNINSIDSEDLARRNIILEGGREISVLSGITAKDVMNPNFISISPYTHLKDILKLVTESNSPYFVIVNEQNDLLGIVSFHDLRTILYEEELGDLVVAEDIATKDIIYVTEQDNLNQVLAKFSLKDLPALPVIKPENGSKKMLGFIHRGDVIAKYNNEVLKKMYSEETEADKI